MSTTLFFNRSSVCLRLRPVVRLGLWASLMLSLAGGCRGLSDSQVDLMERELRQKEDYIYELEDIVVEYSEKLRSYRGSQSPCNNAVRSNAAADAPEPELAIDKPRKKKAAAKIPENEALVPELLDIPEPEIPSIEMDPPALEIEDSSASLWRDPETMQPVAVDTLDEADFEVDPRQLTFLLDPIDDRSEALIEPELLLEEIPEDSEDDVEELVAFDDVSSDVSEDEPAELDRVVISKVFRNLESASEHGSLLTIVEILDTAGRPMEVQGEVSLMIRSNLKEKPKRLERWDFDSEETLASWQSSSLGEGLHLELPLEKGHLPDEPLELLARLVAPDGRISLTRLLIDPTQIAALEAETGAEQLVAEEETIGDEHLSKMPADFSSELVIVESSVSLPSRIATKTESKLAETSQPRWRASQQRSNDLVGGYSSTARPKTHRWTSQPLGGRPVARPTTMANKPPSPAKATPIGQSSSWTTSSRPKDKAPVQQPVEPAASGWSAWR